MKRILKILEHPAWNGVSCLLTFIGTFGLVGIIIGIISKLVDKSKELVVYLSEPITLPKYYLIIGFILLLGTTLTIIQNDLMERRKRRLRDKESIRQGEFFRIWGVLWRYIVGFYDEAHVEGPFCPTHLLQMESGYQDGLYAFRCKGNAEDGVHYFQGPKFDELSRTLPNLNIKEVLLHDVGERIRAELRKQDLN
jgi:hypothetical protein